MIPSSVAARTHIWNAMKTASVCLSRVRGATIVPRSSLAQATLRAWMGCAWSFRVTASMNACQNNPAAPQEVQRHRVRSRHRCPLAGLLHSFPHLGAPCISLASRVPACPYLVSAQIPAIRPSVAESLCIPCVRVQPASHFPEPAVMTAIPFLAAVRSHTRRATMIAALPPPALVPTSVPAMPTVCVSSAAMASSTQENFAMMGTRSAATDALRCAFPRRSLQAAPSAVMALSKLWNSVMTETRSVVMVAMGHAIVKWSSPALLKINVQQIAAQVPGDAKNARRAISVRAVSAIPMGHADHHRTYALLVHMIAATAFSLLPKNATMPMSVTATVAPLPAFSNTDSVEMVWCNALSEKAVNPGCTIPHCPIPVTRQHVGS